ILPLTRGGAALRHSGRDFAGSTIWVWITMAASVPSPRVMSVCSTMVVRPECSGVHTGRAVSPLGIGAKKLVLLSIVAVRWSLASAALAVMPPMVSAQPITAPPCITPRRLHNSSRMNSSASLRSGDRLVTLMPMSLTKPEASHSVIVVLAVRVGLFQIAHAAVCCPGRRDRRQPSHRGAFANQEVGNAFDIDGGGDAHRRGHFGGDGTGIRPGLFFALGRAQHVLQAGRLLLQDRAGDPLLRQSGLLHLRRVANPVPARDLGPHSANQAARAGVGLPGLTIRKTRPVEQRPVTGYSSFRDTSAARPDALKA